MENEYNINTNQTEPKRTIGHAFSFNRILTLFRAKTFFFLRFWYNPVNNREILTNTNQVQDI